MPAFLFAEEVKWRHLTLSAVIEMQQLPPLISLSGAIKLKQDLGSHSVASAAPKAFSQD